MAVRLGVAPIAWSNDDMPELGGDTPLEVCLKESREAGYSGTESGGKFPMDPDVLGPVLAAHDIKLVSGWFSGRLLEVSVEEEKRRLENQLHTFAALGAPVIVYAEVTGSVQGGRTTPISRRPKLAPGDTPLYLLPEEIIKQIRVLVNNALHSGNGSRVIDILNSQILKRIGDISLLMSVVPAIVDDRGFEAAISEIEDSGRFAS